MTDESHNPQRNLAAETIRKKAESKQRNEDFRTAFEARVEIPTRRLRQEWDAAWNSLRDLLAPIYAAIRCERSSEPIPDPTLLAIALKSIGNTLQNLDQLRETQRKLRQSVSPSTINASRIPIRPTERLARVLSDERFETVAPRIAAQLLLRAVSGTPYTIAQGVREILSDDTTRIAFGWLECMRDHIWPQSVESMNSSLPPQADPIGPGPASDDYFHKITRNDCQRVETLLEGWMSSDVRDLFPEWFADSSSPPVDIKALVAELGHTSKAQTHKASAIANDGKPTSNDLPDTKGKPSKDKQDDILAAIRNARTPLTRPELIIAMRLKREGKLGANLAWMVRNQILISIRSKGYWPIGEPKPD